MIAKVRTGWFASVVLVALAVSVAHVPTARGQYVCCENVQSYPFNCQSPGCVGNEWINECAGGYGSAYWWTTTEVYCCVFGPEGALGYDTGAYCGPSAPAGLAERVWVRDCKGRYALLTVPIRAYRA